MQLWITAKYVIIHYCTSSAATKAMHALQEGFQYAPSGVIPKNCLRKYTTITVTLINLREIFNPSF